MDLATYYSVYYIFSCILSPGETFNRGERIGCYTGVTLRSEYKNHFISDHPST